MKVILVVTNSGKKNKVTLEQLKKLDARARQTRREFYPLAKQILGKP